MALVCGIPHERFSELYWKPRPPYDRGDIDGPAYWTAIVGQQELGLSRDQIATLIKLDSESITRPNQGAVQWAKLLHHEGFPLTLLSNMPLELSRHVTQSFPSLSTFEYLIYSCDYGSIKPELSIYRNCLEQMTAPLTIEPISIRRREDLMHPVSQLSFDSLPQMTGPKNLSRSAEPDDEEESQEDELLTDDISMPGTTKLSHFVLEFNRRLQAIAETGCQNGLHSHKSWFEQLGAEADNSGLISLGRVLHGIGRTTQVEPRAILQARYLSLHSQALGQFM